MYPEARYDADAPGTPGPAGPFAEYAEVKQGDHAPRPLVAGTAVRILSLHPIPGKDCTGDWLFFRYPVLKVNSR